ncbi:MAG: ABC transporter substrate-binding protein [Gaiella sp.]
MSRTRIALGLLTGLLALLLVGPGSGASGEAATDYPVSVTVTNGTVAIARKPTRIVSLSPTATESLFAIGAGPQVIAVDDQSDYPKQAPKTNLSGFTPNVEAIVARRPDLVVISYSPKGFTEALEKFGITVLHMDAAKSLKGAYQQIRQLGRVTDREAAAARVTDTMKARIAAIVKRARPKSSGRTVFHELSPDLYSATSATFAGRVYELFGLKNIADAADSFGSGYPQLAAEYVVAADPDVVVLADTVCCAQTAATVAARPGWSGMKAVKTGSVVRIDDSIASRWGPRIVNFVRAVGSALRRLENV